VFDVFFDDVVVEVGGFDVEFVIGDDFVAIDWVGFVIVGERYEFDVAFGFWEV